MRYARGEPASVLAVDESELGADVAAGRPAVGAALVGSLKERLGGIALDAGKLCQRESGRAISASQPIPAATPRSSSPPTGPESPPG